MDFSGLIEQCAPEIAPYIMERIIKVESSFNPFAIGVVGGHLAKQPQNKAEAIATVRALHKSGWNFSMGLGQINRYNLSQYNLDYETVFEPCANIGAVASIYNECFQRALLKFNERHAMLAAHSCYYSGNFKRGFQSEKGNKGSYVQRILAVKPISGSDMGESLLVIPDSQKKVYPLTAPSTSSKEGNRSARLSRLSAEQKDFGIKELRGERATTSK